MPRLDNEEKELLDSVEAGEWQSVDSKDSDIERYRQYARSTFKKDRRINIRLSAKDLEALQKRALIEGVPYQTLISSVLHKYVSGRLKEGE
jgi:predicted DNA binding CopG/RHH family protein